MVRFDSRTKAEPGKRYLAEMPWSEVCIHMDVAGKQMYAELLSLGHHPLIQLFKLDGTPFSFPILPGEAGFYQDGQGGFYFYPPAHPVAALVISQ